MYTNAQIYRVNCKLHYSRVEHMIERLGKQVKWDRPNGNVSLLDIGCGPGNVTMELLLPLLPETYDRVVASDIAPVMIENAKNFYNPLESGRISFEILDIDSVEDTNRFSSKHKPFDHITSINCLQYSNNQRQTFTNIYELLKPDGDCFIMLVANNPLYDFFLAQSEKDNYKDRLSHVKDIISPYQNSKDTEAQVRTILQPIGFKTIKVEVLHSTYQLEVEELKSK